MVANGKQNIHGDDFDAVLVVCVKFAINALESIIEEDLSDTFVLLAVLAHTPSHTLLLLSMSERYSFNTPDAALRKSYYCFLPFQFFQPRLRPFSLVLLSSYRPSSPSPPRLSPFHLLRTKHLSLACLSALSPLNSTRKQQQRTKQNVSICRVTHSSPCFSLQGDIVSPVPSAHIPNIRYYLHLQ